MWGVPSESRGKIIELLRGLQPSELAAQPNLPRFMLRRVSCYPCSLHHMYAAYT